MERKMKHFAGDSFFTAGGNLDVSSTQPLTVAFIGGSLTEGEIDYEGTSLENQDLKWSNVVIRFLSGLFPLRPLKAINVGLGGTGSEYGAARFEHDVLSHDPDLIFIEFSCNDCPTSEADCEGFGKRYRQMYLESMIRQCMRAPKVPAIVYMHVPVPYGEKQMRLFEKGCAIKQEVLDHYGIGTINAMADFAHEFAARQKENPDLTREEFLKQYYEQYESGGFNVHPYASGYLFFALSVINALGKEPEKYFSPFQMREEIYCREDEKQVNLACRYLGVTSDRIDYRGEWRLYTAERPFENNDPTLRMNPNRLRKACHFPRGIMQVENPCGASFSFETEADRICMPHISAKAGLCATVYADGQKVGEATCQSIWHGMNYMGSWIPLPKGKKSIRFEIQDASAEPSLFRFGYIIEGFENESGSCL